MARLRTNNLSGTAAGNGITLASGSGSTSVSWASSPGFATITAPDYYPIVVEPDTANEEVIWLTAYTSGATSGTCVRGKEGTSSPAHSATAWQHGPTAADYGLGRTFNVLDFGAVADGTYTGGGTDNTTAFQNALTEAGSSSTTTQSATVLVPPGIWMLGPVTIPNRVTLMGMGAGATTLVCKSSSAAGNFIANATDAEMVTVQDLRLAGNAGNQSNAIVGLYLGGTWTTSGSDEYNDGRYRATNLHVEQFTSDGVSCASSTHNDAFFENIQVWQVQGHGFNCTNDSFYINCDAANCKLDGFHIQGNSQFTNCKAWFCGWYGGTSYVTSNSTATGSGFYIGSSGGQGAMLMNCYAQDNGRSGFYFNGSVGVTATGLVADSNNNNSSGTTFCGIEFDQYAGPVVVGTCYVFDRGANTQHQNAAFRFAAATAPAGVTLNAYFNSSAYMSTMFSSDSTYLVGNLITVNREMGLSVAQPSYAATFTPNPLNGSVQEMTLTGNVTVAVPAANTFHTGTKLTFIFTQDATGGRTITFNSGYVVTRFTAELGASATCSVSFVYDGTNWIEVEHASPLKVGLVGTPDGAAASLTVSTQDVLAGTKAQLKTNEIQVGTTFKFTIQLTKTAAGTATWTAKVCFGPNGTSADTAVATWTSGTNTAAIDSATLIIIARCTAIGSGTSATFACTAYYQNELTTATGLGSIAIAPGSTAGFNSTAATPYVHVDITPGASAVMTAVAHTERLSA